MQRNQNRKSGSGSNGVERSGTECDPASSGEQDVNRKSAVVYGAITSLVVSIISFLLVGLVLDRWLKTAPWLLVGGIILGTIAGFVQFIRGMSKIT